MPLVVFESMIAVFERAKTVHALDRAATVFGTAYLQAHEIVCKPICDTPRERSLILTFL
jgi:hypothetical protein